MKQENSGTDSGGFAPSLPSVPATPGTQFSSERKYDAADFPAGTVCVTRSMPCNSLYQRLLSFGKKSTIGIDFGNGYLKAVKFVSAGAQKRKMTAYLTAPNEKNLATGDLLPGFLKSLMKKFCYSSGRSEIWAVIPLENMETRFLTVPAVAEKDLANAVFWAYKKAKPFDEEGNIFDFVYIRDFTENGAKKKAVMAYTVERAEIEKLAKLFSESGFPLTGISAYPFAIQNLVRSGYIKAEGQNVCCLYVGMNWSRIDIFFADGYLAMSSRIQACMTGMMEELRILMNARLFPPAPEQGDSAQSSGTETRGLSSETVRKIFFCLIRSSPELDIVLAENQIRVSAEELFEMLIPSINRLVWRLERIIEKYQTDIGKSDVGKIFISGELSGCRRVVDHIGTRLDQHIETRDLDPFSCDFVGENMQIPESAAERGSYVPAAGMALSRNFFTPNFLFTHKHRQKYSNSRRADHFVSIVFALIAIVCLCVFFHQDHVLREKDNKLDEYKKDFEDVIPKHENRFFDRDMIRTMADGLIERKKQSRNFAMRYANLAVIASICEVTVSPHIRLTDLKIIGGETKEGESVPKNKAAENSPGITVEGIISADTAVKRESFLLDYVSKINAIPLFQEAVCTGRAEHMQEEKQTPDLHFTLYAKIRIGTKKNEKQP